MAQTKSKTQKDDKTMMEKMGDQATHIKEDIIAGKDHLVELAQDAISSVKSTLIKLTTKKPAKKLAKKSAPPAKKVIVKTVKPSAKKAKSTVTNNKKATPLKKAAKKAIKKSSTKK